MNFRMVVSVILLLFVLLASSCSTKHPIIGSWNLEQFIFSQKHIEQMRNGYIEKGFSEEEIEEGIEFQKGVMANFHLQFTFKANGKGIITSFDYEEEFTWSTKDDVLTMKSLGFFDLIEDDEGDKYIISSDTLTIMGSETESRMVFKRSE